MTIKGIVYSTIMNKFTSQDLKKDLKYLKQQLLKIHPNPFFSITENQFDKEITKIANTSEQLTQQALFFELMKVFAKLGDSHTRIKGVGRILSGKTYSVRYKYLNENYFISAIDETQKKYIGCKVLKANDIEIAKIIKLLSTILTHENNVVLCNAIEQWLFEPDLLRYLGIIGNTNKLSLTLEDNKGNISTIPLLLSDKQDDELFNPRLENIKNSLTLNPKGRYWTKYFENIFSYYLQYNECEDITKEEIEKIIKEITEIAPKYVVIDLKNNLGGSSSILDPLTDFLNANQDKYVPIVFISNITYSAGIINALNIMDCKNAISIGTPTAGSPTKFGETTTITLPNTQFDIEISTKYFKENGYKYGDSLIPLISTSQTIDQYLKAVDIDWRMFLQHFNLKAL